jgi:hypothetical protein
VAVWESLLGGGRQETTLRVTMAMSWLLEKMPAGRDALQGELTRIYDLRSRVVHGDPTNGPEVYEASFRAAYLVLQRRLESIGYGDRP